MQKLKNKNLTIVGDSLQLQLFENIIEVLQLTSRIKYTNNGRYKCLGDIRYQNTTGNGKPDVITATVSHGYNGFIKYIAVFEINEFQQKDCFLCLTVDKFVDMIRRENIVMLNLGLHFYNMDIAKFSKVLIKLIPKLKWLSVQGTQIIFKVTLPQHLRPESHSMQTGLYHARSVPDNPLQACTFVKNPRRHAMDAVVRQYAQEYGFQMFDDFDIFSARWDLHQEVATKRDCTHYCFTMETIMPQLALLSQYL